MIKKQLLFYLFYLTSLLLVAQDVHQNFLDSLSGKFISDIRKQSRPKAWLVTDKSIFKPGENIWFRGCLLNSASNKVIHQNTYFFVDLVDEKDSIVSSVLLDGANQNLGSKITLPGDLPSGYYWLRAYTKQMAEADTNHAFVKPVYLAGAKKRISSKTANAKILAATTDPVIQFFPEGGNIITGANSTVAFLIKDPQGKPLATDGFVKDSRDSIAARFTSNNEGVGKFSLEASYFRKYKAFINWNGKQISFPLPSFNLFAGQTAITKQPDGNKVLRVLLEDSIYKKNVPTYLIGVSKDSLCFAAVGYGQYELLVPEQKFPEGIATFYLFDKNGKFLSERSIYIKENNITVKATPDKNIYSKRDKVTLNISVIDANNHPVPSLLSVSVADSAFIIPGEPTIGTGLNNQGLVHNSALAFRQNMADEEIDLLMMLHSETYQNKNSDGAKQTSDRNDSLLFIKGKALDEQDKPAANKILTLFTNNGESFVMDTTDNVGLFRLPVYNYPDSTEFAIGARNLNNSSTNVKIIRDPLAFPRFNTPASQKRYFSVEPVFSNKYKNAYFDTITNNTIERENEVTVKGKKKKEPTFNEALRVSPNSTIIAADQLDERKSTGDIVLNSGGGLHTLNGYLVINGLTSMKAPDASSEPLLLIDGAPAPGGLAGESPVLSMLNSINPKEIDFIEILKGPEGSNYGLRGGNGVILVNMAHQSRKNFVSNAGNLQTFYAKGISKPSPFPLVNYDSKEIKSSERFDNRSTIYWNGNILTGGDDHLNISFFTSDIPTTYKVIISGITARGDTIYKTVSFTSK